MTFKNNNRLLQCFLFICLVIPMLVQGQESEIRSMDDIVEQTVLPHLRVLIHKLDNERLNFELDGVRTFDKPHNFLPGKIALGFSYLILATPKTAPEFDTYIHSYNDLAKMTLDMDNVKWGAYYYMLAIYRLQEAGLLDQVLDKDTLEILKVKLDWRKFVSIPEYKLQEGVPTNYYGVAFSIARLRFLMGWETEAGSNKLLEIMFSHIDEHSGAYGFSDETEGEGRFDRYSIVLIAELCARFLDTNAEVPKMLNERMRKSVDFILPLMNQSGAGLQYGRSIGPYGDGIFGEILSTAAMMGILSVEEMEAGYAFQTKVTERLMNFWYDSEMQSINFWENGRLTDPYRNKSRILDENLSLIHQHLSSYNFWKQLGYTSKRTSSEFSSWLMTLPRYNLTWFAKGKYERAHLTIRDNNQVIELPMVGGGKGFHEINSYFPIPYSVDMVQGSPFRRYPQLLPQLTLEDGVVVEPLSFFKTIRTEEEGSKLIVRIKQVELDRVKLSDGYWRERIPKPENRISVETTYVFDSGSMTRTDYITPNKPLKNVTFSMEFAGFSTDAVVNGNTVNYGDGVVQSFETNGYQNITVEPIEMSTKYASPVGAMSSLVKVSSKLDNFSEPITVSWTLNYQN